MTATQGSTDVAVDFTVNGDDTNVTVPTSEMLIDTVRDRLGLTGTNLGCDHGACGACTVRVEGDLVAACSTFTWQADGTRVVTIEGLGSPEHTGPEQEALAEQSALQCGYCTPGMVMTTAALLDEIPEPDRADIVEWLGSNICRCTGYEMIIEAVQDAARRRRDAR